jgi:hypothetical protein
MRARIKFIFSLAILFVALARDVLSRDPGDDSTLFQYNNPFKITITYDFRELSRLRDDSTYIPGWISYFQEDSTLIERSIAIRPRGNSRRDQCQHPPLRIDFNDSLYGVSLFDGWGKMKLVSKCLQAHNFDNYVLREYLIYQAFQKLTNYSFRTYLLNITFLDSSTGKRSYESPGFFIEDIDDLEERLNAVEIESMGLKAGELDTLSFDIVALFQYMIGNTDWYIQNLHNIKLVKFNDHLKPCPVPIPYDFDYAGLVNASYAVPHESLALESVRERHFMGVCRNAKDYTPVFRLFMNKKDEIYGVFTNYNSMSKFDINDISRYLDGFYSILEGKNPGRTIYGICE